MSACAYMGVVLCGLLHGLPREHVLGPEFVRTHLNGHSLDAEVEEVAHGSYRRQTPIGSGYVVRSLEAALWAFHDAADFREAVLAQSTSATTPTRQARSADNSLAHISGVGIPAEWRDGLRGRDIIDPILSRLLAFGEIAP